MITQDNLDQLLVQLGFTKSDRRHSKAIGDATLTVDRKKGKIVHPEAQGMIINEQQTCNLLADENFIVLEYGHRLLEEGYKPAIIAATPTRKQAILEKHL